jgi:DMSO/TMAO reductase YedYZ molybdopterin-dependent catalytic subunit
MNIYWVNNPLRKKEATMEQRRQFLKILLGFFSLITLMFSPFFSLIRGAYSEAKRVILPKGTKMESLIGKAPEELDTRNLEVTHLKDFQTMGLDDYEVDLDKWRLQVTGKVKTPLHLKYSEIKALPVIRRNVLLICPGFFALNGDWKGFSVAELLKRAGADKEATNVKFYGPEVDYEKMEKFPIDEVLNEKVFLAYEVNGETLPRKHGFPLRVVADDHYGGTWVKYVYKVTVE